jgi:hypothetical protein
MVQYYIVSLHEFCQYIGTKHIEIWYKTIVYQKGSLNKILQVQKCTKMLLSTIIKVMLCSEQNNDILDVSTNQRVLVL